MHTYASVLVQIFARPSKNAAGFFPSCARPTRAMKPQSCKSKGRRFQQRVVRSILDALPQLEPDDVRSTSMGAPGEDVLLSPRARQLLPLSLECKCVERLNVWQCVEQARSNCPTDVVPCVVFSRNRADAYAVVPWPVLLTLFARVANDAPEASTAATAKNAAIATNDAAMSDDATSTPSVVRDATTTPRVRALLSALCAELVTTPRQSVSDAIANPAIAVDTHVVPTGVADMDDDARDNPRAA